MKKMADSRASAKRIALLFLIILSCSSVQALAVETPPKMLGQKMIYDQYAHVVHTNSLLETNIFGPGPLLGERIIYDPIGKNIYVFGGTNSQNNWVLTNALWKYDIEKNVWSLIDTEVKPTPRFDHVMVYMPTLRAILVFGGVTDAERTNDTWLFDIASEKWKKISLDNKPYPRSDPGYCYDEENNIVIIFSGYMEGLQLADTWAFDPATKTWIEMKPSGTPLPLNAVSEYGCRMVYDSVNKKVIMFGGHWKTTGERHGYDNDVWIYDYGMNTWTLRTANPKPSARYTHYMAFDPINAKVVVFGGHDTSDSIVDDTWTYQYSTNKWDEVDNLVKPSNRHAGWMTYVPDLNRIILYGGGDSESMSLSDIWSLKVSDYNWDVFNPNESNTAKPSEIPAYPVESLVLVLILVSIVLFLRARNDGLIIKPRGDIF